MHRATALIALVGVALTGCSTSVSPTEPGAAVAAKAATAASAAKASKTAVCHLTGQGGFVALSVSSKAVPAHLAHGDLPGQSAWAGDFDQNGWEYTFSVAMTECAQPGEVIAHVDYGIGCDPGVWVLDGYSDGTLQVTESGLGEACYNSCRYEMSFDPESNQITGNGLEEANCSPENESGWTFVLSLQ